MQIWHWCYSRRRSSSKFIRKTFSTAKIDRSLIFSIWNIWVRLFVSHLIRTDTKCRAMAIYHDIHWHGHWVTWSWFQFTIIFLSTDLLFIIFMYKWMRMLFETNWLKLNWCISRICKEQWMNIYKSLYIKCGMILEAKRLAFSLENQLTMSTSSTSMENSRSLWWSDGGAIVIRAINTHTFKSTPNKYNVCNVSKFQIETTGWISFKESATGFYMMSGNNSSNSCCSNNHVIL